jgi:hypothetical protein
MARIKQYLLALLLAVVGCTLAVSVLQTYATLVVKWLQATGRTRVEELDREDPAEFLALATCTLAVLFVIFYGVMLGMRVCLKRRKHLE